MGKSLIDNPLADNDVVINSVTGRRFSQEAIEENKATQEDVKEIIKEDVKTKEPLTKDDTSKINELLKDYKKEVEEKPKTKSLEEQLKEVEEANEKLIQESKKAEEVEEKPKEVVKKTTKSEKQYIKKTYLISQDNIDLIEGLALYTGKERKEVVEELLQKATDLIDPTIIEKALREVRKSKKEEITKEIF